MQPRTSMHAPFQSDFWLVYLLEAINWRIFEKVLLRSNMKRWLKEKKQAKKEHCQKFSRHLKKAVSVGYFSVFSTEISHKDYLPCGALNRKNKMTCFLKILPNRKIKWTQKKSHDAIGFMSCWASHYLSECLLEIINVRRPHEFFRSAHQDISHGYRLFA